MLPTRKFALLTAVVAVVAWVLQEASGRLTNVSNRTLGDCAYFKMPEGSRLAFLRKVLAVFAYLCDEIHELSEVAEAHFFPRLAMFGEPLSGHDDDDDGAPARDAFGAAPASREIAVGRLVPFLQELSNFVERCHACCVNMVHQLAALYNPREKLHQSTFKHTRLTVAYRSLGDLLHLEHFSLHESMSALEMMDAQMDSGLAASQAWAGCG